MEEERGLGMVQWWRIGGLGMAQWRKKGVWGLLGGKERLLCRQESLSSDSQHPSEELGVDEHCPVCSALWGGERRVTGAVWLPTYRQTE